MILNSKNIDSYKPSQIIKALCLHCDNHHLDEGNLHLRNDMSKLLRQKFDIFICDKDFEYYCKEGFYED